MKRLTIAGIFIGLSLLLSGCFAVEKYYQWKYAREKEEIIQIVESSSGKYALEQSILNEYPDAFSETSKIKFIKIDYSSLKYTPASGMNVRFFVNGNSKFRVDGILSRINGENYFFGPFTYSLELEEFLNE